MCGSGMAAISAMMLALVQQGDRLIVSNSLYGRSTQLFTQELPRLGVQAMAIDARDHRQVRAALDRPAKLLFVETISNPLLCLADISDLAEMAHERGCLLAVDNTFATPWIQRPIEAGFDMVVHSATKYLNGHSDMVGGVIVVGDNKQLADQIAFLQNSVGAIAGGLSGHPVSGVGMGAGAGAAAGLVGVLLSRGPDAVLTKGTTVEMILDRRLEFDESELDFGAGAAPVRRFSQAAEPAPAKKEPSTRRLSPFPF